jgi:hypothetical protein
MLVCLRISPLLQAGLTLDDVDVYEINEAFASQATYCVQKLGLDENKVRVGGHTGALLLLGCCQVHDFCLCAGLKPCNAIACTPLCQPNVAVCV